MKQMDLIRPPPRVAEKGITPELKNRIVNKLPPLMPPNRRHFWENKKVETLTESFDDMPNIFVFPKQNVEFAFPNHVRVARVSVCNHVTYLERYCIIQLDFLWNVVKKIPETNWRHLVSGQFHATKFVCMANPWNISDDSSIPDSTVPRQKNQSRRFSAALEIVALKGIPRDNPKVSKEMSTRSFNVTVFIVDSFFGKCCYKNHLLVATFSFLNSISVDQRCNLIDTSKNDGNKFLLLYSYFEMDEYQKNYCSHNVHREMISKYVPTNSLQRPPFSVLMEFLSHSDSNHRQILSQLFTKIRCATNSLRLLIKIIIKPCMTKHFGVELTAKFKRTPNSPESSYISQPVVHTANNSKTLIYYSTLHQFIVQKFLLVVKLNVPLLKANIPVTTVIVAEFRCIGALVNLLQPSYSSRLAADKVLDTLVSKPTSHLAYLKFLFRNKNENDRYVKLFTKSFDDMPNIPVIAEQNVKFAFPNGVRVARIFTLNHVANLVRHYKCPHFSLRMIEGNLQARPPTWTVNPDILSSFKLLMAKMSSCKANPRNIDDDRSIPDNMVPIQKHQSRRFSATLEMPALNEIPRDNPNVSNEISTNFLLIFRILLKMNRVTETIATVGAQTEIRGKHGSGPVNAELDALRANSSAISLLHREKLKSHQTSSERTTNAANGRNDPDLTPNSQYYTFSIITYELRSSRLDNIFITVLDQSIWYKMLFIRFMSPDGDTFLDVKSNFHIKCSEDIHSLEYCSSSTLQKLLNRSHLLSQNSTDFLSFYSSELKPVSKQAKRVSGSRELTNHSTRHSLVFGERYTFRTFNKKLVTVEAYLPYAHEDYIIDLLLLFGFLTLHTTIDTVPKQLIVLSKFLIFHFQFRRSKE
ncbi:hypothetical protein Bhyg_08113 [Pseudolycoriella hygida]|uniref:Uncharacterized protein n=1 Tax=Pseudolycoriella hygida TaxID=35572 RepID=A0A9Q0N4R9_9DIPT|nr:hypothetical protein Bhyg_08113 [Pseudolycoriella hygida]